MANSESTFRTELVDEMKKANWHVVTIGKSPFMIGVPDLYIHVPDMQGLWLELKYERATRTGQVPVKLSPFQRKFLRDEQKAGGYAGWAVCVQDGMLWNLFAGTDYTVEKFSLPALQYRVCARMRSQSWNIHALVEKICG
jgi:hypothetical protein